MLRELLTGETPAVIPEVSVEDGLHVAQRLEAAKNAGAVLVHIEHTFDAVRHDMAIYPDGTMDYYYRCVGKGEDGQIGYEREAHRGACFGFQVMRHQGLTRRLMSVRPDEIRKRDRVFIVEGKKALFTRKVTDVDTSGFSFED